MSDLVTRVLRAFDHFVLAYFIALNTIYLVLILIAGATIVRAMRRPATGAHDDIFANPMTPAISVVMSAHNEAACIIESARAALDLRYPEFEVVIVEDGSTDDTFELLEREFDLVEVPPDGDQDVRTVGAVVSMHVPRGGEALVVVRKVGTGRRADGINAGINAARHPLVCCIDADSILDNDALLKVARPFVDDPERVVATGGAIRAINGSTVQRGRISTVRQPRRWVERIQVIEYLRSFHLGRTGWSQLRGLVIISGAFGLYRRDLLVAVGGFDPISLGEDLDVVVSLHRHCRDVGMDYRIVYVPEPACWTEVPPTRQILARQRARWSHGLAQVMWKQRTMFGRPRYGRIGSVSMPYYVVFELLGPVVELVGVVAVVAGLALGVVDADYALLFAAVAFLYAMIMSIASLVVEEVSFHRYARWRDIGGALVAVFIENVGFRQLHAWWRLRGLVDAVRGTEPGWGEMTRAGFGSCTDRG